MFDDPKRDGWQKPHEVIQALALKPDATVADIGAGTGYFSVRLAHRVPKGKVYAVDLEPDMVRHLAARAKREQLPNVLAVQAAPDDPRLPQKVDLVLLVDTYHHLGDPVRYFSALKQGLAPQGRVAPPRHFPGRALARLHAAGAFAKLPGCDSSFSSPLR